MVAVYHDYTQDSSCPLSPCSACLAAASGGSRLGSPVTSGVTRRQSHVYFVDCKGILNPILRTLVQKSTLLLQNRRHAEVLKKDPFFREICN